MMIIDVEFKNGEKWMRYTSDFIPRIGDSITTLKPDNQEAIVVAVDHLIRPKLDRSMFQELVTITVE